MSLATAPFGSDAADPPTTPPPAPQWLAMGAEECRPLRLDDPLNAAGAADGAKFARPIVDAMVVLIAAGFVERVAVRAIGQRRAFIADRHFENLDDGCLETLPLVAAEPIARQGGMNAGGAQALGCVEIPDPCRRPVVE